MNFYIRERFKLVNKRNPISGHRWTEHGPTTGYRVVGPTGVLSLHRTDANARKALAEWVQYFARINNLEKQA